mgnify:CR=1 FL=1|jgi:hypothetical protein
MSKYRGYEKYNAILLIFLIRFRPFIQNDQPVVIISHQKKVNEQPSDLPKIAAKLSEISLPKYSQLIQNFARRKQL